MKEHAEASASSQQNLLKDVNALMKAVEDRSVGNPEMEQNQDLITLTSGEIMDPEIATCYRMGHDIAKDIYHYFIESCVESCSKALTDTIPRLNLYSFMNHPPADLTKDAARQHEKCYSYGYSILCQSQGQTCFGYG